jgi:putative membrane protein insertion efficiency factor
MEWAQRLAGDGPGGARQASGQGVGLLGAAEGVGTSSGEPDTRPRGPLTRLLLGTLCLYKRFLSPLLPRTCRFEPSCSQYAYGAILKYGPWRGSLRAAGRLLRCHPFHPGGIDPP